MKITKIFLLTFLLGVLAMTSCQKKGCTDSSATNYSGDAQEDDGTCTFIPTITLTGNDTVTVAVGSTYSDPGATATNQDLTLVAVITDTSNVNTAQTGTYTVTYTATNSYGTATATRTVIVAITQAVWTSNTWTITDDCSATLFPLSSPVTITAGATAADLLFNDSGSFFTAVGGTGKATVSGNTITFPSDTVSLLLGVGDIIFSGTGTINNTGTEFIVNYTYDNTTPLVGGNGSCTATYTR